MSAGPSDPHLQLTDPESPAPRHHLIAPLWHLVILILFFAIFSIAGFKGAGKAKYPSQVIHYLVLICVEWAFFAYVWFGLWRGRTPLREVVGGQWRTARDVFRDIGIALGFWIGAALILGIIQFLLRTKPATLAGFAPRGVLEIFLWGAVAASAGICEESVFRGYLQKQFQALTRSTPMAIVLQGIVFGFAHGYQGWKFVVTITFYGLMFGILAEWRKTVRPGMIAHGWQDFFSGIVLKYIGKLPQH